MATLGPAFGSAAWRYPSSYGAKTVLVLLAAVLVLWFTGQRLEIDRMVSLTSEAVLAAAGIEQSSEVADGLASIGAKLFPLQVSERVEVSRIDGFDRRELPPFSHLEVTDTSVETLNPETLEMERRTERTEYLVRRFGYLEHVAAKMLETLEIALWGTVLAVLLGFPLALMNARNLSRSRLLGAASSAAVGLLRSVPELISALFLVIAYGFGPIAGVLALALHAAGFLGKFYAEDIENADLKPQDALRALGASRLKLLRYAILPQVLPQYTAYTLYILDRNVRMATVIGLVGAGGIGQELKGRYDMYDYPRVATILAAIFLVVLLLDRVASRLRRSLL
jgi:phosphonate transport system permease protein